MRKQLLFLTSLLAFTFSNATNGPLLNWGLNIPANVYSMVKGMATDASGNVYITGSYNGVNVDFDFGSGVTSLTSTGTADCFVAKYSASGQLLWVKNISGTNFTLANSICLEGGNVWIAGDFTGTVDFDPSAAVVSSTSAGGQDAFVLKLDGSTGNYLWRGVMGGASSESAQSITQDELGRIILVGQFNGTTDFDPGVGTTSFTAVDGYDIWFVCLNNAGVLVTAKQIGGLGNDVPAAVKSRTNAGSPIAICGSFGGTVDFDWGAGTVSKTANGNRNAFVLVVNSLFQFQWVNTFGGVKTVDIDGTNKIIVGGALTDTLDMDPSAGVALIYSNPSSPSAFIAKYSASGAYEWAFALRSVVPFSNVVLSICTDVSNNVYATGYSSTFDADPTAAQYTISCSANRNIFLLKYNSSGQIQWGAPLQSISGGQGNGDGNAIAVDASSHIFVGGSFQATIDIDPSPINLSLTALGTGSNALLAQYGICDYPAALTTVNDTVCQGTPAVYSASGTGVVSWYNNPNDNGYVGGSTFTLNNATIGAHTYWVQDSTCGAGLRSSKTIYVAPNPTATIAAPSHICDGDVLHLTGFGAAVYDWSTQTSGQDAVDTPSIGSHTYYLVGTNTFGCRDTTSATVSVTALPQPNLVSANSVACLGVGTRLFDADQAGVDYTWSTTQTGDTIAVAPTQATTYAVTVVDGVGCAGADTITIAVSSVDVTITQTGNVLTVAEVGASFYQWGNCATNIPIDSANDVSYTVTANGSYAVFVMNANGCVDTSDCFAVTLPSNIASINENFIQISPNPFSNQISIQSSALGNTSFVEVYNAVGALVKREKISSPQQTLSMGEYANGVYLLQVSDGEKKHGVRLVKE